MLSNNNEKVLLLINLYIQEDILYFLWIIKKNIITKLEKL